MEKMFRGKTKEEKIAICERIFARVPVTTYELLANGKPAERPRLLRCIWLCVSLGR